MSSPLFRSICNYYMDRWSYTTFYLTKLKYFTLSTQIRPSFLYKEEYSDCKSIKGRFHQYFIHGESIDCLQWKRDYDNSSRFEEKNDLKAAKAVIESEEARRQSRFKGETFYQHCCLFTPI